MPDKSSGWSRRNFLELVGKAGGAAAHIRRHGRRRNWQPAPTESWQEPAAGRSGP